MTHLQTDPSDASRTDPFDNMQGNYILRMKDIIGDETTEQFQILALLGMMMMIAGYDDDCWV